MNSMKRIGNRWRYRGKMKMSVSALMVVIDNKYFDDLIEEILYGLL